MAESADLGHAVGPLTVPDRQFRDLHIQSSGAEEQIKIAERIEVAEECPTTCDLPDTFHIRTREATGDDISI